MLIVIGADDGIPCSIGEFLQLYKSEFKFSKHYKVFATTEKYTQIASRFKII